MEVRLLTPAILGRDVAVDPVATAAGRVALRAPLVELQRVLEVRLLGALPPRILVLRVDRLEHRGRAVPHVGRDVVPVLDLLLGPPAGGDTGHLPLVELVRLARPVEVLELGVERSQARLLLGGARGLLHQLLALFVLRALGVLELEPLLAGVFEGVHVAIARADAIDAAVIVADLLALAIDAALLHLLELVGGEPLLLRLIERGLVLRRDLLLLRVDELLLGLGRANVVRVLTLAVLELALPPLLLEVLGIVHALLHHRLAGQ